VHASMYIAVRSEGGYQAFLTVLKRVAKTRGRWRFKGCQEEIIYREFPRIFPELILTSR